MVIEVKLNLIPFPNPNETSRNIAAKRPKKVFHSVRELFHYFTHFNFNRYFGG